MSHRERAKNKLHIELEKNIKTAVAIARNCRAEELLYLIYELHLTRLITFLPRSAAILSKAGKISAQMTEDTLKYAISLIAKHGKWQDLLEKKTSVMDFNIETCDHLKYVCQHINSKFDIASLLDLAKVKVTGERDQHCEIDLQSVLDDPELKRLADYFYRIEAETITQKSVQSVDTLFQNFSVEHSGVEELFEEENGLTVDEYMDGIRQLLSLIESRWAQTEEKVPKLANGNIDIRSHPVISSFASALIIKRSELKNIVSTNFMRIMGSQSFKGVELQDSELRFHYINRKPFLRAPDFFILSPEILVDSIFINTHYSLIESKNTKQKYLDRQSRKFVEKIAQIANRFGYSKDRTEVELYEGKRKIGDVDLILKNDDGRFLLIEAKNHSLPLEVYFKQVAPTIAHKNRLLAEWEKKVSRRISHLRGNHSAYEIESNFTYILISKHPEVVSHYSPILSLSLLEFESWLEAGGQCNDFQSFYSRAYSTAGQEFTLDEMNDLHKDGFMLGTIVRPDSDF